MTGVTLAEHSGRLTHAGHGAQAAAVGAHLAQGTRPARPRLLAAAAQQSPHPQHVAEPNPTQLHLGAGLEDDRRHYQHPHQQHVQQGHGQNVVWRPGQGQGLAAAVHEAAWEHRTSSTTGRGSGSLVQAAVLGVGAAEAGQLASTGCGIAAAAGGSGSLPIGNGNELGVTGESLPVLPGTGRALLPAAGGSRSLPMSLGHGLGVTVGSLLAAPGSALLQQDQYLQQQQQQQQDALVLPVASLHDRRTSLQVVADAPLPFGQQGRSELPLPGTAAASSASAAAAEPSWGGFALHGGWLDDQLRLAVSEHRQRSLRRQPPLADASSYGLRDSDDAMYGMDGFGEYGSYVLPGMGGAEGEGPDGGRSWSDGGSGAGSGWAGPGCVWCRLCYRSDFCSRAGPDGWQVLRGCDVLVPLTFAVAAPRRLRARLSSPPGMLYWLSCA